jgi:tRNA(fMet)-specific endonuclease VapC
VFETGGPVATSLRERDRWDAFLAPFYVLSSTPDVSWEYGRAYRYLQENGRLIGSNDLWIAATGLAYRMPVVTRNRDHYRRVPGLQVEAY